MPAAGAASREEATHRPARRRRADWLKAQGKGYQTRINRILRAAL